MKCPECNNNCTLKADKPVSPIGSERITMQQHHMCVNPKCIMYAGTDLNNPKVIVSTNTIDLA